MGDEKETAEDRRKHDEMKDAVKEALREWLDEKYAQFGKWSLHGLLALGLAAIVVLILWTNGWHK